MAKESTPIMCRAPETGSPITAKLTEPFVLAYVYGDVGHNLDCQNGREICPRITP
jgi:hypothetical protein